MYSLHVVTLDGLPAQQHYQAVNKAIEKTAWWYSGNNLLTPKRQWHVAVSDDNSYLFNPDLDIHQGIPSLLWLKNKQEEFLTNPLLFIENLMFRYLYEDTFTGRDFAQVAHKLTKPTPKPLHEIVDYGELFRAARYLEHLVTTYPDRERHNRDQWDMWKADFWQQKFDHTGVTNLMKDPYDPTDNRYAVLFNTIT